MSIISIVSIIRMRQKMTNSACYPYSSDLNELIGAFILECITKTYSFETCDEFYEFESLPEMQIMELLTSEINIL